MRVLKIIFVLCLAGVGVLPTSVFANEKTQAVSVLLKEANELMSQAQVAYIDGDSKVAIEKYRATLKEIERVEQQYAQRAATSEFAPVRFRKALCETEVDRIMLEEANATARTVAVTDTSALEAKVAARNQVAITNAVTPTAVTLNTKQGAVADSGARVTTEPATTNKANIKDAAVAVKKELEWAKDMLVVDRFTEVDQAVLKVLKMEPANREARFLMALSCVQQGKHVDASVVLDGLLADQASDESVLLLASGAYASTGNYVKAMAMLDQAMKLNPQRPDGYYNMAWLLLEMNPSKIDDPELYYRQSVKLGGARDRALEKRFGMKSE